MNCHPWEVLFGTVNIIIRTKEERNRGSEVVNIPSMESEFRSNFMCQESQGWLRKGKCSLNLNSNENVPIQDILGAATLVRVSVCTVVVCVWLDMCMCVGGYRFELWARVCANVCTWV